MAHNNDTNTNTNNNDNHKLLLKKKQFYCQCADFRSTTLIKIQKKSHWMGNIENINTH